MWYEKHECIQQSSNSPSIHLSRVNICLWKYPFPDASLLHSKLHKFAIKLFSSADSQVPKRQIISIDLKQSPFVVELMYFSFSFLCLCSVICVIYSSFKLFSATDFIIAIKSLHWDRAKINLILIHFLIAVFSKA